MERHAKIVATIGPACQEEAALEQLLQAGVNVARLNFSHGSYADHETVIHRLRGLSERLNYPVCIMQDLRGPKIRTGDLASGEVELVPDRLITLTTRPVPGDEKTISVDYPDFPRSVVPGGRILLDDGSLELTAVEVKDPDVLARVVVGGILKPHKGINLPKGHLSLSALTEKDEADLAFGLKQGVDMIALSFVRAEADVTRLKQKIGELAPDLTHTPVIAKLERPEALENLESIVHAADGVMVARGDLGVEMSPEEVPIAQKKIIECANRHGKLVITATQMLDSMIHNPRPTRAEASDVANAVLDGSDAVMLSGETAMGAYPLKAVQTMDAIICQAEAHLDEWGHWHGPSEAHASGDDAFYVALAARQLAQDRNVEAVAVFTISGHSAQLMSKTRPNVPILAFTPVQSTYNRMALYWGVEPHLVPHALTVEAMLVDVEKTIMGRTQIRQGQQVVLVCGFPLGAERPANLALLHTLGSLG